MQGCKMDGRKHQLPAANPCRVFRCARRLAPADPQDFSSLSLSESGQEAQFSQQKGAFEGVGALQMLCTYAQRAAKTKGLSCLPCLPLLLEISEATSNSSDRPDRYLSFINLPTSSIKRLLQRPIHCCLHIEPETKHLRVCKRQHLRADNPRHALLSIAPPPQIWQSCPHGRVRRPPCRPAGEHKRQSPALLLSWRAGIEVGDGVGEPRLRIRDALFAELGDLGDLILKHLLDRARFQDLGTRRGRGAIVQQGCEDLFASPWLIFRTQPVLKEPESRDTYERTLAAWRNTPRRRC